MKKLFKRIIRTVAWIVLKKAVIQVLTPRCRRDDLPEYGRFTPREMEQIILQTDLHIKELMSYFKDHDSIGNYQNEYSGLLTMAVYRALVNEKIAPDYAVSLVGDMQWQSIVNNKGIIPFIDPLRKKLTNLISKDPMTYLGKRLKDVMKYPYSEPGYKIKLYMNKNMYCMDIYSCPVFDFFKQFGQEEMNLFRRTWCTFDFSAAERIVDGCKYLREHTLSDGDEVCDMRWFIERK